LKRKVDLLLFNIEELLTLRGEELPKKGERQAELSIIKNGAVAIEGAYVVGVGESNEIREKFTTRKEEGKVDLSGYVVLPGLVDPHTHLVYGGDRHEEFTLRLKGVSYDEILEKGGGINSTVRSTREKSEEELFYLAKKRLWEMIKNGTTTVEIKSGYGLSTKDEIKILKVTERLKEENLVNIVSTFLGAHFVPPEFLSEREKYLRLLLEEMLEKAKPYSDFCDVFCEKNAFSQEEAELILMEARKKGYKLKIHADELTHSGGSMLAASLKCRTADHIVYIDEEDIRAMRESGVIGVLLPSTSFLLGLKKFAPARRLIEEGVPVALATDHNPGTSPIYSMLLVISLGVLFLSLKPEEAIVAATANASCALSLEGKVGTVEEGKLADLIVLDCHSYLHIPYEFGRNLVKSVIKSGKFVF